MANKTDYKFVIDKQITVKFEEIDLSCYSRFDSINIFKTKGEFNPVENLWTGSSGIVTWERAGSIARITRNSNSSALALVVAKSSSGNCACK